MLNGLTSGLKIALGIQFVLALLFLAMGWSHSSSLTFGRTPSFADMIALGSPLVLVIAGALLAASAARRGKPGLARLFGLIPLPLALVLAMLGGMV